jgi:hypothetical protein
LLLLVALVALPLAAGCTPTTNDPDDYDAVTEANVLDGCVRAQYEDPGSTRVITITENEDGEDVVDIPDDVPADLLNPCQCIYDQIVEQIPFDDFEEMDGEDLVVAFGGEAGDESSDGTTTTTSASDKELGEIIAGCAFAPG